MRRTGLDAEGSDRYLDNIDMIPALNSAIEWLCGIIAQRLGKDKFVEERLSDLHHIRIWQTNQFSRVSLDESIGFKIWTLTGVFAVPKVYVTLQSGTQLPDLYRVEITPFLNKQYDNKPIVTVKYDTGLPMLAHESTFRPELSFINSAWEAAKITHEQMGDTMWNPFSPGFKRQGDFLQYAYIPFLDYSGYNPTVAKEEGKYILETYKEIQLLPDIRNGLIGISFIRVPEQIPIDTNTATYYIPLPASMMNILVQKALNVISVKQGDGTTIFNVTLQEVIQQLQ